MGKGLVVFGFDCSNSNQNIFCVTWNVSYVFYRVQEGTNDDVYVWSVYVSFCVISNEGYPLHYKVIFDGAIFEVHDVIHNDGVSSFEDKHLIHKIEEDSSEEYNLVDTPEEGLVDNTLEGIVDNTQEGRYVGIVHTVDCIVVVGTLIVVSTQDYTVVAMAHYTVVAMAHYTVVVKAHYTVVGFISQVIAVMVFVVAADRQSVDDRQRVTVCNSFVVVNAKTVFVSKDYQSQESLIYR